jgi:hypothetical protein
LTGWSIGSKIVLVEIKMKKYFALDTKSGDLRLRFIGEFESIGEAIEKADKNSSFVMWVLAEEDFQLLVKDYNQAKAGK